MPVSQRRPPARTWCYLQAQNKFLPIKAPAISIGMLLVQCRQHNCKHVSISVSHEPVSQHVSRSLTHLYCVLKFAVTLYRAVGRVLSWRAWLAGTSYHGEPALSHAGRSSCSWYTSTHRTGEKPMRRTVKAQPPPRLPLPQCIWSRGAARLRRSSICFTILKLFFEKYWSK